LSDIRNAARALRRRPGFSITAIATLALAIGAVTTVFSLVDAVLIEPLPYAAAGELVVVRGRDPRSGAEEGVSAAVLVAMRGRLQSFSGIEAYSRFGFERGWFLTVGETSEAVRYTAVTEGFFDLLGVPARLGRPTGQIVVSESLWRRRFGATETAVGTTIRFEGRRTAEVSAVMPAAFALPDVDVWSRTISPAALAAASNAARTFEVIARLKPGVSLATARAEVEAFARQLAADDPGAGLREQAGGAADGAAPLAVAGLQESMTRRARPVLMALQGAAVLVLLTACANVASLVLARALARRPELAVRAALGASRNRLRLHAVSEPLGVTLIGTLGGLLSSAWGLALLRRWDSTDLPGIATASIHGSAFLLALGAGLLAAGILSAAAVAALPGDKPGGRGAHGRLRFDLLIAAQATIAVVLLAAAGLLVQTTVRLNRVDLGFDPAGVLTAEIRLPIADFGPRFPRLYHEVVDRVRGLDAVGEVGVIDAEPFGGRRWDVSVWNVPGAVAGPLGEPPNALPQATAILRAADGGYFRAMRIPLLRGRQLAPTDRVADTVLAGAGSVEGTGVAVVNQTLARRLWPGEDPVGRFVVIDDGFYASLEIVGVVGDTRFGSPAQMPEAELFVPYAQLPGEAFTLVARAGEAASLQDLAATVRASLAAIGSELAVRDIRPLADIVAQTTTRQRLATRLLTGFALATTLLVVVGVYGILSFTVSRRTRELAIYAAVGATPATIRRLAFRSGMTPVVAGLLPGIAATATITRSLRSILYEVSPADVPTLVASIALLTLAAWAACAVPAHRAARVDPAVVLRRNE
jgi:predicted permease